MREISEKRNMVRKQDEIMPDYARNIVIGFGWIGGRYVRKSEEA